jgi:hypothetical protein
MRRRRGEPHDRSVVLSCQKLLKSSDAAWGSITYGEPTAVHTGGRDPATFVVVVEGTVAVVVALAVAVAVVLVLLVVVVVVVVPVAAGSVVVPELGVMAEPGGAQTVRDDRTTVMATKPAAQRASHLRPEAWQEMEVRCSRAGNGWLAWLMLCLRQVIRRH